MEKRGITGDELVVMMRMAGIKSPELAKLLGYKTPWRIYAARAQQSNRILIAIDRALEQFMSSKHYNSALEEIRGLNKGLKMSRVRIDKGVTLPNQIKRDLAAIAEARKVWIHVTREMTEPPKQDAASVECRLLGGEELDEAATFMDKNNPTSTAIGGPNEQQRNATLRMER